MNIMTIPYITGGISHLIPLYVLHQKYLRNNIDIKNHFLVNSGSQRFLNLQGINCVPIDYIFDEILLNTKNILKIRESIIEMEMMAYDIVKPKLIIEDTSFTTPLIADKNNTPRISIQRTGIFRSIDKRFRNFNHVHSFQKGGSIDEYVNISNSNKTAGSVFNDFLIKYANSKAKIIPGIPTIECLPKNTKNRDSYFYSGASYY